MRQSATALDYDLDELEYVTRPRLADRRQERLVLLDAKDAFERRQCGRFAPVGQDWAAFSDEHHGFAASGEWMVFVPHRPIMARERQEQRHEVKHPGWLLGTFIGVLALVAVVSPVFANGHVVGSSGQPAWALSGYGVVGAAKTDATVQVPVVDVSTPNQKSAQPPNRPAAPSAPYDVTESPSISVRQIEVVLQQYGSPAVGKGQALYDAGLRFGINPAYALAFFVHESGCGTKGVARFTHSIGNIRWTDGYNSYGGYRSYASWEEGIEDWYRLISDLYVNGWRLRTVDSIVPVYAPYGDNNNPPAYIAAVKQMVDAWRGK